MRLNIPKKEDKEEKTKSTKKANTKAKTDPTEKAKIMWNYTLLDVSGSMREKGSREDTETKFEVSVKGIQQDLQSMREDTTGVKFKVAIIEFDGTYAKGNYYRYVVKPDFIENVKYTPGTPNDLTPLYATIGSVLEDIIKIKPKDEPCIVTVFTDGAENSSRGSKYYHPAILKEFIAQCERENISVKFIGTHHDVLSMNTNLGISMNNMVSHDGSSAQLGATYAANNAARSRMTKSFAGGASAHSLIRGEYYSQEDRDIVSNINQKQDNGNSKTKDTKSGK